MPDNPRRCTSSAARPMARSGTCGDVVDAAIASTGAATDYLAGSNVGSFTAAACA